jgi:hypothetical protein
MRICWPQSDMVQIRIRASHMGFSLQHDFAIIDRL